MSKKSLVDSITVKTPCSEDWNQMRGDDKIRFCSHCDLSVNNISALTRKQAMRLVRESDGRLCVRYVKTPQTSAPVFADQLYQIKRRVPRLAVGAVTAALGLSSLTCAQDEPKINEPQTSVIRINQLSYFDSLDKVEDGETKTESAIASVSGAITDPYGAAISNVSITLTSYEDKTIHSTISNEEGFYEFKNLASGNYSIKAGGNYRFKTSALENLTVPESENLKRDISMEIDGQSLTVGLVIAVEYKSALHKAVANNDLEEVKNLIIKGENINSRDEDYSRITPLFLAVENGNLEIAETLLAFGAKVNARDENRQTPLMRLDEDAGAELVRLLIKHGAKLNLTDVDGNAVLMHASRGAKAEVLEVLLRHGVAVNAQNKQGRTALMEAAEADNLENVRILLEAGADANLKNEDGETVWDLASEEEIKQLLESFATNRESDR